MLYKRQENYVYRSLPLQLTSKHLPQPILQIENVSKFYYNLSVFFQNFKPQISQKWKTTSRIFARKAAINPKRKSR